VRYTVCGGTVSGCVILADTVGVGSKSTGAIAVGPNPFVPGVTRVDQIYDSKTVNFYQNVINNSGGGNGIGILIAVDAPKPLETAPGAAGSGGGNTPYGKVVIYDAVGNIVRSDALYRADGAARSYGYVWDGKNQKGRYVGPGTYLVQVSGRDTDKVSFSERRKIGVKKEKK
jgi:hypothetical protein